MTNHLFHVTTAQSVQDIQEEGIREDCSRVYSPRKELDIAADKIGQKRYNWWVPRQQSVYFWETRQQALDSTQEVGGHYDRLLIVQSKEINSQLCQLPSEAWEDLYLDADRPHDLDKSDPLWNEIVDVVEKAEKYDGSHEGTNEVWTYSPVSSDTIHSVETLEKQPE